ncbi:MAG TPA: carboxylating nicotinate-nucleotide diphosphorylase [Candidatus Nanoarchaeia archaeon]|nr:carboxylating nicotinate-nucleotide diphosphorylase [Candidatus Nanoarchaeia archaeon]
MQRREDRIGEFWDRKGGLSIKNKDYRNFVGKLQSLLLRNDVKKKDLATSPLKKKIKAVIISKDEGIVAGLDEFSLINKDLKLIFFKKDGEKIKNKDVIVEITGDARIILPMERTNLNLLQRMSGIATLAFNLSKISGKSRIAATRKTPWGLMDKKAVSVGGGLSHRLSLNDGVIIKDNHLELLKYDFRKIINLYRNASKRIEIEVENKNNAISAATAIKSALDKNNKHIFALMLDKINPHEIKSIIRTLKKMDVYNSILLEASGNINEGNLANYASCGVDIISMGYLTNSAKALDLSQEIR